MFWFLDSQFCDAGWISQSFLFIQKKRQWSLLLHAFLLLHVVRVEVDSFIAISELNFMYDHLNSMPLGKKIIKSIIQKNGKTTVHFCNIKVTITGPMQAHHVFFLYLCLNSHQFMEKGNFVHSWIVQTPFRDIIFQVGKLPNSLETVFACAVFGSWHFDKWGY